MLQGLADRVEEHPNPEYLDNFHRRVQRLDDDHVALPQRHGVQIQGGGRPRKHDRVHGGEGEGSVRGRLGLPPAPGEVGGGVARGAEIEGTGAGHLDVGAQEEERLVDDVAAGVDDDNGAVVSVPLAAGGRVGAGGVGLFFRRGDVGVGDRGSINTVKIYK